MDLQDKILQNIFGEREEPEAWPARPVEWYKDDDDDDDISSLNLMNFIVGMERLALPRMTKKIEKKLIPGVQTHFPEDLAEVCVSRITELSALIKNNP